VQRLDVGLEGEVATQHVVVSAKRIGPVVELGLEPLRASRGASRLER
jgi:hypothetical protein